MLEIGVANIPVPKQPRVRKSRAKQSNVTEGIQEKGVAVTEGVEVNEFFGCSRTCGVWI